MRICALAGYVKKAALVMESLPKSVELIQKTLNQSFQIGKYGKTNKRTFNEKLYTLLVFFF